MDFTAYIEIPQGGSVKYEVDPKTGKLFVDRILHTAMIYPANYGYVQGTLVEEKDPLDVLVLSSHPIIPGAEVKCHPIGLLGMDDNSGFDSKIIAVPDSAIDPEYGKLTDIKEVDEIILKRIKHFFEHYKELEPGKWVKVGEFEGKEAAEVLIEKSKSRS